MSKLQESQIEIIKNLIAEKSGVDVEKISNDLELKDNLGIDSLDIVELIMELEEEFNCTIPDEDYESSMFVKDIIEIVENRI